MNYKLLQWVVSTNLVDVPSTRYKSTSLCSIQIIKKKKKMLVTSVRNKQPRSKIKNTHCLHTAPKD